MRRQHTLILPVFADQSHCIAVPMVDQARVSAMDSRINTSLDVTCNLGYRFPNGQRTRPLECDSDLAWREDPVPPCLGRLIT